MSFKDLGGKCALIKAQKSNLLLLFFLSTTLNATVYKIGVITDIHYGTCSSDYVHCTAGVEKTKDAIADFAADDCNLIIQTGDYIHAGEDFADIDTINAAFDPNSAFDPADGTPRIHCIGNHDCYAATTVEFLVALQTDDIVEEQDEYFSYDLGNLHLVILNPNYVHKNGVYYNYSDPNKPDDYDRYEPWGGTPAYYIPPEQMAWLESNLQAADAAGKFSVIFSHQAPAHPGHITNYLDVQDLFEQHNVILSSAGHGHAWCLREYIGTNISGRRIRYITVKAACLDAPEDDPNYACIRLDIDDQTGAHTIKGYGSETSDGLEYGDAPEPTYQTLLASDGARHIFDGATYLGATVDAELNGQPCCIALGDHYYDGSYDEDGVIFTSLLIPGQQASVNVTASTSGLLNAWVDFDGDGDWDDAGDKIFTDQLLNAGLNNLTFSVPAFASLGVTFARFRFDTHGCLSYTGLASDGEVEDYHIMIGEQNCEPTFDFNNDEFVEFFDLLAFLDCWLSDESICCLADYNTDGDVNFKDFASFSLLWLDSNP